MRGAILRTTKAVIVCIALCLALVCQVLGQAHDRFENQCSSLRDATPPDLLRYLNEVTPDEENGWCVTFAIHKLGRGRYEPAIPALVKLLNFRRPQTEAEKSFHGLSQELFPAQGALESIGKKALPEVLLAIKADSTSTTARDNAVFVWMEIYKYERAKGVALLRHEQTKANSDAIKQRLGEAVQKALTYCYNVAEEAACRRAATTDGP